MTLDFRNGRLFDFQQDVTGLNKVTHLGSVECQQSVEGRHDSGSCNVPVGVLLLSDQDLSLCRQLTTAQRQQVLLVLELSQRVASFEFDSLGTIAVGRRGDLAVEQRFDAGEFLGGEREVLFRQSNQFLDAGGLGRELFEIEIDADELAGDLPKFQFVVNRVDLQQQCPL